MLRWLMKKSDEFMLLHLGLKLLKNNPAMMPKFYKYMAINNTH